ncbi:MAG: DUF3021 domain-containing protein [Clostridia bacterium]|nr:DUF3021 domain-containing protein [Clostridia bacterium]
MRQTLTAKKVLVRLLIGFVIGMIVGVLIPLITTGGSLVSSKVVGMVGGSKVAGTVISILLSGVMGLISFGGTLFYEIDSWNIAKATTLHLAIILAAYLSIGLFLDWLPHDIKWIFIMVAIMTAVFFMIWIIMYLIGISQTKKLNEIQKKYNDSEKR